MQESRNYYKKQLELFNEFDTVGKTLSPQQTQITGCGLMVRHLTTVTVQQFRNQGIAGSSPVSQASYFLFYFSFHSAH